jgi:hypothetical protein
MNPEAMISGSGRRVCYSLKIISRYPSVLSAGPKYLTI